MDEVLARRYAVLINNYAATAWLKELILDKSDKHPTLVRPDAVFFSNS